MEGEKSEEFQLVPNSELEALRSEIEELKKNPVQNYQSSLTLIESMDRLADQLTQLLQLFERANSEMYTDYQKGLHEDSEKLNQIIAQNEKLAKGILALADGRHKPATQEASYPLNHTKDLSEAPWKREKKTRRSLVREFQ